MNNTCLNLIQKLNSNLCFDSCFTVVNMPLPEVSRDHDILKSYYDEKDAFLTNLKLEIDSEMKRNHCDDAEIAKLRLQYEIAYDERAIIQNRLVAKWCELWKLQILEQASEVDEKNANLRRKAESALLMIESVADREAKFLKEAEDQARLFAEEERLLKLRIETWKSSVDDHKNKFNKEKLVSTNNLRSIQDEIKSSQSGDELRELVKQNMLVKCPYMTNCEPTKTVNEWIKTSIDEVDRIERGLDSKKNSLSMLNAYNSGPSTPSPKHSRQLYANPVLMPAPLDYSSCFGFGKDIQIIINP